MGNRNRPGFAFSEHIRTGRMGRRHREGNPNRSMRSFILFGILALGSLILLGKLISLQLVQGAYYRSLSDSNRIRTQLIYAPRGVIFDRYNVPLVFNIPGFRGVKGEETVIVGRDEALERLAKGDTTLSIDSLRQYPYKDAMAHVLGYVGQITAEELKEEQFSHYNLTDWIGKSGLEYEYEELLRGINGKKLVEVDASGKEVRVLGKTDPIAGKDITTTLDSALQKAAYEAMEGIDRGAVVVSTPTGEILAMVSVPSYDPNLFTLDDTYEATDTAYLDVGRIVTDSVGQPLLNRAVSGTYPPASTFKIITSAAGLEQHIIDKNYSIEDTGILKIGSFSFANWYYTQYGKTDGMVDVVKGLARSNDIFYYKLAEKIGVDRLSQTAAEFGVGSLLGIDIPGEAKGVLPTKKWKEKNLGEPWYLGDNYHYGIGQGYLLTTPLQVNSWTQAIANGGNIYQPHLLKGKNKILNKAFLSGSTLEPIRQGMIAACSEGGTAYPLFNVSVENSQLSIDGKNILQAPVSTTSAKFEDMRKIVVACKTGTAEHLAEHTSHAWLTAFAPAYNPEIVVTVIAEESGEGSQVAAPITKKILEAYFKER